MRNNHEIQTRIRLLDEKGRLNEPGYTKGLLMDYRRSDIKAAGYRIKEWDYYLIATHDYAVALTVADNSYMGLDSISLLDFRTGWEHTNSPMQVFTFGKKNLPAGSDAGDVKSAGKNYSIEYKHNGDHRDLFFYMTGFDGDKHIEGELRLENPEQESMVIVTPYKEDPKAFYYNQKINCMKASGTVKFGDEVYDFDRPDAYGVLDWGRGVWTKVNTWYWGSASGAVDGVPFGWNIGYGFGDTSAASENMLFYNGKAHKLGEISFNIPGDGNPDMGPHGMNGVRFMEPWTFSSDDGRFEMNFTPVLDRSSCTDVKVICSDQHQVFGYFSGTAVLDDGTKIQVDDFLGFAEKVYNKW